MGKWLYVIMIASYIIIKGMISPSYAALDYENIPDLSTFTGDDNILIVINSSICNSISSSLEQYVADIAAEERYNVTAIMYIGGTAQELKDYIRSLVDLKGVVFIGDLPVPIFEIDNDFGEEGAYTSFPCDLFYMDLDGEWLDSDSNGKYDIHNACSGGFSVYDEYQDFYFYGEPIIVVCSGDLEPEIWLGRLTASTISRINESEADILESYFIKNHSYRTGELSKNTHALAYVDDTWDCYGDCSLSDAYMYLGNNVTTVTDHSATIASDYKDRLENDNYEWVQLCCHSGCTSHSFENNDVSGGYVYNTDICDIDPEALFYNLFCCSSCRYTYSEHSGYIGGHYIFTQNNGLLAVGSTKSGSMMDFESFYYPLGGDLSMDGYIGESFNYWFNHNSYSLEELRYKSWFYGMTILGDPTLRLDPPIASIDSVSPTTIYVGDTVTINSSGSVKNSQRSIVGYALRSSIDGYLSNDSSFSTSSLSAGDHTIYFKVKDNKGRWSSEVKISLSVLEQENEAISIEFSPDSWNLSNVELNSVVNNINMDTGYPMHDITNTGNVDVMVDVKYSTSFHVIGSVGPSDKAGVNTFATSMETSQAGGTIPLSGNLLIVSDLQCSSSLGVTIEYHAPTELVDVDESHTVKYEFRAYGSLTAEVIDIK